MTSPNSPSLRVNIYAQHSSLIKELGTHLQAVNAKVAGIKGSKLKLFTQPDYAISWGAGRDAKRAIKVASSSGAKLVILLPLVVPKEKDNKNFIKFVNKIPKNIPCKIIWLGDDGKGFGNNFNQGFKDYLLISPHDAARVLAKAMFSFWGKVEEITITDKIPQAALVNFSSTKAKKKVFQGEIRGRLLTPGTDTISRIFINPVAEPVVTKVSRSPKLPRKRLIILMACLVLVLITPLVLLMFSGVLGYFGYQNLNTNPYQAERLFDKAESLANFTSKILPIRASLLMQQTVSVGRTSAQAAVLASQLKDGVLGEKEIDINYLSEKLKLDLDKIYADSAFLETEVGENNFFDRKDVVEASNLIGRLPDILGVGEPKTYLVLIQDSLDGVVGSVALVTFQDGELIDINQMSSESVDAQFSGLAQPPNPKSIRQIKVNSDFAQSAPRAVWFLDKSIDVHVDGVVGVMGMDLWERVKKLEIDLTDLKNKNIQVYFTDPSIMWGF